MTSFDYPAAGALPDATLWLDFALTWHVRNIAEATGESFGGPTAVAFVQTEMLPTPPSRLGTRQGNRLQRGTKQLDIVSVGTGDRDAQRHTATIRHNRSLDAELTAIGGVFAGFFPHPTAPWSWLRPALASAIRSRVVCHTFADISLFYAGSGHLFSSGIGPYCRQDTMAMVRLHETLGNLRCSE